jgi:hypothetical protein
MWLDLNALSQFTPVEAPAQLPPSTAELSA